MAAAAPLEDLVEARMTHICRGRLSSFAELGSDWTSESVRHTHNGCWGTWPVNVFLAVCQSLSTGKYCHTVCQSGHIMCQSGHTVCLSVSSSQLYAGLDRRSYQSSSNVTQPQPRAEALEALWLFDGPCWAMVNHWPLEYGLKAATNA